MAYVEPSAEERGEPSRTAMGAAYFRAAHRRLDSRPWILDDPVAAELLPEDVIAELDAARPGWPQPLLPALQAHFSTRSRLAEDVAVAGLAHGRADYVILGAGLDTFAWRHDRAGEFTVWELDHPDTQAWKRRRLADVGLAEPGNVRFVPVDLSVTPLGALALPPRASWNWLGVTVYLEKATTAATLQAIAAASETAVVVIEFALALEHCDELGRAWRAETARFAGSVGERHVSLYAPDEASEVVQSAGFELVEAIDAERLTARYLRDQPHLQLACSSLYIVARTPSAS